MTQSKMKPEEYRKLVSEMTPHSRHLRGCFRAFWVGGLICTLGQALNALGEWLQLDDMTAPMFTSVVLIFLGTTLSGIGIYDKIGRYAGCGSIVPITGFANSVAAPALEFRREGIILGIGAKLFTIAGPVLVYGIVSSILLGVIYWAAKGWLM